MGFLAASVVTGALSGQNFWIYEDTAVRSQALNPDDPGYLSQHRDLKREHEAALSGGLTYGGATAIGLALGIGSLIFAQWHFD